MSKRKGINSEKAMRFADGCLYLRRGKASPNFLESVAKKVKSGEYVHRETTDDVEVYDIAEWSPLFRIKPNLGQMTLRQVEMAIILAACDRDFKSYHEAASELALRYRGGEVKSATGEALHLAAALEEYQRAMLYIEQRILRRGGPSGVEIQMRLRDLAAQKRGRVITTGRRRAH